MNIKPLTDSFIYIKPSIKLLKYLEDRNDDKGRHTEILNLLNLDDLKEIYEHLRERNISNYEKIYFHEIFEGSTVILPKNEEVVRSPDLENRCLLLKKMQEDSGYKRMTKYMGNNKQIVSEDTIAYQLKQMNKQLVVVLQFVLSVSAGFAFGFYGSKEIVQELDFQSRLVLGALCAFTIAVAEFYFLIKSIHEDISI